MKTFLFLLSRHRSGLRDRLRFVIRFLSSFLVWAPRRYCVVGVIPAVSEAELLRRLAWFFHGQLGSEFHVRLATRGRCVFRLEAGALRPVGNGNVFMSAWFALVGKVLVYDYGALTRRLDVLLHYKVFIINWERTFVTSSWRACAAVADRPWRGLADQLRRRDMRPRAEGVVVVGNGPSAFNVFEPQYQDMDIIVCNTAIKSHRLMSTRRVVAHCFIDAAFFAGPSEYTRAFIDALRGAAASSEFTVYCDFEHLQFLRNHLPEIPAKRFQPIFIDAAVSEQVHFREGHVQTTNHSVSTTVMFPLSATYYRNVYLLGFDGKNPEIKDYFWKHSDEFQFNALLPTVRDCDPGFFAGRDYGKHSTSNDEETDRVISSLERAGVQVVMTHPSFIKCLHQRYVELHRN